MNLRGSATTVVLFVALAGAVAGCGTDGDGGPAAPSGPTVSMQLRPVLTEAKATGSDCAPVTTPTPAPGDGLEGVCSSDGKTVYSLGPAAVTEATTDSIATAERGGRYVAEISFDRPAKLALATMTTAMVGQQKPKNSFAVVVDGVVVDTRAIKLNAITDGVLVIEFDDETVVDDFALKLSYSST